MDFMALARKVLSKINEDKELKELTPYTLMFLLNTTKYEVVMPILEYLERRHILEKIGRKWVIVGRDNEVENGDTD